MQLTLNGQLLEFREATLSYKRNDICNVFAKYNKTVGYTLSKQKYQDLYDSIETHYPGVSRRPLGRFLLELKEGDDPLYKKFLNDDGDSMYCEFELQDSTIQQKKGIYLFSCGGDLKYIGKTTRSYKERINSGYGRISPKNCYLDGQRTNCRLNALVATSSNVKFYVYPMVIDREIERTEKCLLLSYAPEWNK
jgi:hypothetical protein